MWQGLIDTNGTYFVMNDKELNWIWDVQVQEKGKKRGYDLVNLLVPSFEGIVCVYACMY